MHRIKSEHTLDCNYVYVSHSMDKTEKLREIETEREKEEEKK